MAPRDRLCQWVVLLLAPALAESGLLFTTMRGTWVPATALTLQGRSIHISAGSDFLVIATASGHVHQVPGAYIERRTRQNVTIKHRAPAVIGIPVNGTRPLQVHPLRPPTYFSSPTGIAKVVGGEAFGAALLSNGTVWSESWGDNANNQLCRRLGLPKDTGLTAGRATLPTHTVQAAAWVWKAICAGEDGALLLSGDSELRLLTVT